MVDVTQETARSWRLRGRIERACGGADQFRPIEAQFADWLDGGQGVARAVVDTVEPVLARYLHDAAREGQRWGRLVGQVAGVVIGVVAGVVAGLLW